MSDAIAGVGTTFKRSDMASIPAFTTIAEVNTINGPNLSRDTIDVTSLDSTDGYKKFIGGFRDSGEVTLNANWTIGGYVDMKTDFETTSLVDYEIVLPDTGATTLSFSALVTALGMTTPMNDKVSMDVTIKISGEVTVTS